MKNYTDYMDNISVDTELHKKIMTRVTHKTIPFHKKNAIFRYTGLAACVAILLFCILTIPSLLNPSIEDSTIGNTPNNSGAFGSNHDTVPPAKNEDEFDLDALSGLPVDNFSLAEIDSGIAADRMVFRQFSDFFAISLQQTFAFVRVVETEQWIKENPFYSNGVLVQTSTLHIISVLWSDSNVPETITLSQSLVGGCTGDEKNNLLRKDGVYLLPMNYWQPDDMWNIIGTLDVLFEVDNEGRIWSHSQYEDFNRFDGQAANAPADIIVAMLTDESYAAASTLFGQIVRNWGVLAEITVLGTAATELEPNLIVVSADNVLSVSLNNAYTWHPENGEEFTAASRLQLAQGRRYLVLFDPTSDRPSIESYMVAIINTDNTITAIAINSDYNNVFEQFNGYTVEQMALEAERAKLWHDRFVE